MAVIVPDGGFHHLFGTTFVLACTITPHNHAYNTPRHEYNVTQHGTIPTTECF